MKSVVGFTFFLLFLAGFAFVFLQSKQSGSERSDEARLLPLVGVDWRPISIEGRPVADDTESFVRFEVDGKIVGHGGCNRFFGSYDLEDSGFQIGPLGSTQMACPEPAMTDDRQLLRAIEQMKHVAVRSESMRMLNADNEKIADFVPATHPAAE